LNQAGQDLYKCSHSQPWSPVSLQFGWLPRLGDVLPIHFIMIPEIPAIVSCDSFAIQLSIALRHCFKWLLLLLNLMFAFFFH
jgi:hypothetical protein